MTAINSCVPAMSFSPFLQLPNEPQQNPFFDPFTVGNSDQSAFEVSDYLLASDEGSSFAVGAGYQQNPVLPAEDSGDSSLITQTSSGMKCESGVKRTKTDVGSRIGFRTKSEVEILDDGFKWRKYGKKSVKNSPNPRNYYRCSTEGCHVKKRVERDPEDSSYVLTTYDGVHNHLTHGAVYLPTPHDGIAAVAEAAAASWDYSGRVPPSPMAPTNPWAMQVAHSSS